MIKRLKYPWEKQKLSYKEWASIDFDWNNYSKVTKSIPAYFFRYNNYQKGLSNDFIIKSTFGTKTHDEIIKEIEYWYNSCVGAYSEIEYK